MCGYSVDLTNVCVIVRSVSLSEYEQWEHFITNESRFEVYDLQNSILIAFDHLIQRLEEHIRVSEELEEVLDTNDKDDVLLQQQRDESVCLSGIRIRQLEEICVLRKIFADTVPGSVCENVLLRVSNMFKELLSATVMGLYSPYLNVTPEIRQKMEKDLSSYALAIITLGHSEIATQISAAYPFNDLDVLLCPED